jgi:hypothetical protein
MVALTIVAIVSVVIALVMTAIVVSMLRNERRRSDARVEALVRLANAEAPAVVPQARAAVTPSFGGVAVPPKVGAAHPKVVRETAPTPADDFVDEAFELDLQPAVAGVGGLFAEPEQSSPWMRRLGIAAAVALAAAVVGFTASAFTRTGTTEPTTTSVASTSGDGPTLELLTLSYEQKDGTLTINGMVQNPKASTAMATGVEVTALVFGSDGNVVASGKAPLDFSRLRPGDESPFVVRVPVTGNIARYRIGFRGNDGRVIAHIDRRSAGPLARNE